MFSVGPCLKFSCCGRDLPRQCLNDCDYDELFISKATLGRNAEWKERRGREREKRAGQGPDIEEKEEGRADDSRGAAIHGALSGALDNVAARVGVDNVTKLANLQLAGRIVKRLLHFMLGKKANVAWM